MARKLNFELIEGGAKATSSFTVYLDSSQDAVENSHYYDTASYSSQKLSGTNGFSAITETATSNYLFRIRILYASALHFCSAWFKLSNNGYGNYITYFGTNGPSNGLYRIVVPCQYYSQIRQITGTTTIDGLPEVKKTIPCTIYLFWAGGYLSGGTTYPPIIGTATFNIGKTYSIKLPTSSSISSATNTVNYRFYSHNPSSPERECSFFNSYGLEAAGTSMTFNTGATKTHNLLFVPQQNVICTGKMAESISYYGSEFTDDVCLPVPTASTIGFRCSDAGTCLAKFSSVKKKHSIILNTLFLSNGTVNTMAYIFTGNSKSYTATTTAFPSSTSGCNWQAYVSDFLSTNYTTKTGGLNSTVTVTIGGYITSVTGWYYKVVAYDATVIKNTTALNSSNLSFTTTAGKLDGAVVFFAKTSSISNTYWASAKKATDGSSSNISTLNVYSWTGGTGGGGGTSTTSLDSIGEFDY